MKCCAFELDKNLGNSNEKPCCRICKFNDDNNAECLLGSDYPYEEI